ncbi:hypothetical protein [Paenibacillus sp. OT2-17]|jgi:hypothetical protein|uniref:hypothetical protein n=1 Tax=Paenibacillus sp. OT2-17 TaxID=2691605 RepID=UPI0019293E39|nr:hypothetical protein [Paenibacillus sp. OT2-17]
MENIYSLGKLIAEQHKRRIEAAERVTAILQMAKMPDEAGLDYYLEGHNNFALGVTRRHFNQRFVNVPKRIS